MGAQLKLIQEGKETMDRQKALEAALAQIDRAFGKGSAMKLGSKETMQVESISTGSLGRGMAAFVDAEHALDPVYAKKLGVDIDELIVSQPDTGEQALEIVDTLVRSNASDVPVVA